MRTLGYSMVLAATLAVAPACNKKSDEADGKADGGDAKSDGQQADSGGDAAGKGVASAVAGTQASGNLGLIPDAADFVIAVSPKAISSSPVYASVASELENEPDFKELITTFKACNLDPLKFDSVVVGVSMTEDFAAVVVGDGVGDDKNASCVVKSIQKQAGDAEIAEVVDKDGKKLIEFTDGRVYLIDGRTLAITTTGWKDAVGGLIDGTGTSAGSGRKKELLAKVDATASIWAVANIPAELAQMAAAFGAPPQLGSVRSVTGSVDLSKGAAIQALAVFDSEATAKSIADEMQAGLTEATGQAPAELANMIKTIKIEASGADLKIAMSATMDDLEKAKSFQPPI